jgi:septum formation protein
VLLASASPRRRELLSRLGVPFEVRPVEVDEDPGPSPNPQVVARRLARIKAEAARLLEPDAPVLAADTVVALDGLLLAKPRDDGEAREMLTLLRGRAHEVVTAVALLPPGERSPLVRHPVTRVTMRPYTDAEIEASIRRRHPFDKAGGYAIQDEALRPAERYDGCYCNVVGLPLWSTIELFQKAGMEVRVDRGRLLPQCAVCPLRPPR